MTKNSSENNSKTKDEQPIKVRPTQQLAFHIFAFLLSLIATLLILVAYFATLMPSADTPAGQLANVPWMIHINQTSSSNLGNGGVNGSAADYTLRQWGFGAFGWCEWNFNKLDMKQPGECIFQAGWSLPDGAPQGSDIRAVNVPGAIGKVLPITSHLLVPAWILMGAYTVLLVLAFFLWRPSVKKVSDHTWELLSSGSKLVNRNMRWYSLLRGWRLGNSILGCAWLCLSINIIVIAVGYWEVKKSEQRVIASYGVGFMMIVVAHIMVTLTWLAVAYGGLRVYKEGKTTYGT